MSANTLADLLGEVQECEPVLFRELAQAVARAGQRDVARFCRASPAQSLLCRVGATEIRDEAGHHDGHDQHAIHPGSISRYRGKGIATGSCHDHAMSLEAMPMPGPFWGPILAGASGAAAGAVLGWLASTGCRPTAGWGKIRPGAMHWTGLVLSAGLAALMAYVVRFVGSSRTDGATQMQILGWLTLLFAAGAVLSLAQMRRIVCAAISWRGGAVRFRAPGSGEVERPIAEIMSLEENGAGWFVATFGDGVTLRIDPYARGADALLQRISDIAGKGKPTKF